MRERIQDSVRECIKANNGITSVRLVMSVMRLIGPAGFTNEEYEESLRELIVAGELFELKFTDPESPDSRAKTLLFLKGTIFINLEEINGQIATPQKADVARTSSSNV